MSQNRSVPSSPPETTVAAPTDARPYTAPTCLPAGLTVPSEGSHTRTSPSALPLASRPSAVNASANTARLVWCASVLPLATSHSPKL
jgi:hypothetical protein